MTLDFSDYDQRNYPVLDPRAGYAEWSKVYDATMSNVMDIDLFGRTEVDWAATNVAELACGTGRIGAWLVGQGAGGIDGVDFSEDMLAHAAAKGVYRSLRCEDMRGTSLAGPYELILSVLACEHVPDLVPVFAEVARLAGSASTFVHVGYHPFFMLRGIPTHFRNSDGENITVETHLHLLSDHVAAATASGWRLAEFHERIVDDDLLSKLPKWEPHRGWPVSFCAVWRRDA